MDYAVLKAELDAGHPVTGAYNVDNQLATNEINAVNVSVPKASMNGDEIFSATDSAEFTALTDHKRDLWVSFTSKDIVNAYDATNIDFLTYIFGAVSNTKTTLSSLRTELKNRVDILGLGTVNASHIEYARTL